jgi:ketosteroid isomerase-like protein
MTNALAQSKTMIQDLHNQWANAFNRGDLAALTEMYTSDAYILPPESASPVGGRAAIEAFWRDAMQLVGDFKCTTVDTKPLSRDAAREVGTCTFRKKSEPPENGTISYAVVWQQEGSQWKLLQDSWTTSR